jgi:AcrR family transcriptional regulator
VSIEGARRAEILETAASLFASSGLRTSLKEIADASGILPGSLYHHFDSKEAIIVELVERYRADLDTLAERVGDAGLDGGSVAEQLVAFGGSIAGCAVRHRAAFLFTLYDPPSGASDQLVSVARRRPIAIEEAVLELLRAGEAAGQIRPGIDLPTFADRLCQVLLHSSLPVFGTVDGPDSVPEIRCRALLDGVAERVPSDRSLDRSAAFAAAERTIGEWQERDAREDERLPMLRSVARAEFGRRGYEATTVRDIAKAAGLSVGSVYRLVGSKDELLGSIMDSFVGVARTGWRNVLRAEGSAVEKLDALTWVHINAVDRFTDEYNIQLAFLREAPPKTVNVGATFLARMNDLKGLLRQGLRSGELRIGGRSADVRAWALFELLWMPESVVSKVGPRAALALARETTLRGISPTQQERSAPRREPGSRRRGARS